MLGEKALRIEPAKMGDLTQIYEIEKECFGKDAYSKWIYRWLLKDERAIFLKASIDGLIAGFVAGRIESNRSGGKIGRIYTLNVGRKFRGMGVGRRLMTKIEGRFREAGCEKIILEVEVSNVPAIKLYNSLGYKLMNKISNYYGPGRDAYRAEKDLE